MACADYPVGIAFILEPAENKQNWLPVASNILWFGMYLLDVHSLIGHNAQKFEQIIVLCRGMPLHAFFDAAGVVQETSFVLVSPSSAMLTMKFVGGSRAVSKCQFGTMARPLHPIGVWRTEVFYVFPSSLKTFLKGAIGSKIFVPVSVHAAESI